MVSLTRYLNKYYDIQDRIVLVYRPNLKTGWGERCLFLDDNYKPHLRYNHRSILTPEVVFEFDNEDMELNKKLVDIIGKRLHRDGFGWTKWYSGNKSTHLHTFINTKKARNIPSLKRSFIRHYTSDLPTVPDMRLASKNHLIRAEHGIHEKTGNKKDFISARGDFPSMVEPPQGVWERYNREQEIISKRKLTRDLTSLETHKGFKYIINSEEFRASDDGRERALFMLIHILKPKYKDRKSELINFLQEWYRYSSGMKLTDHQIASKVNYHWNRNYNITSRYINELLESIGRSDLCER